MWAIPALSVHMRYNIHPLPSTICAVVSYFGESAKSINVNINANKNSKTRGEGRRQIIGEREEKVIHYHSD